MPENVLNKFKEEFEYPRITYFDLLHNAIVSKNIQFYLDLSYIDYTKDQLSTIFESLLNSANNINKQNELIEILNNTIENWYHPENYDKIKSLDDVTE